MFKNCSRLDLRYNYWQYYAIESILPFLWNTLCYCATLPGWGDDFDIIMGKFNQISQGAWFNNGWVGDKVLLKIHWLNGFCERNLDGNGMEG